MQAPDRESRLAKGPSSDIILLIDLRMRGGGEVPTPLRHRTQRRVLDREVLSPRRMASWIGELRVSVRRSHCSQQRLQISRVLYAAAAI